MIWNGFHVEQKLDKVAWNLTCPPSPNGASLNVRLGLTWSAFALELGAIQ